MCVGGGEWGCMCVYVVWCVCLLIMCGVRDDNVLLSPVAARRQYD